MRSPTSVGALGSCCAQYGTWGHRASLPDLGLLSRLPLGGVTSWRHAVHPGAPDQPVFSRDLLEVEVLNERRTKRLFTLYNTHLKSHFVAFGQDPVAGAAQPMSGAASRPSRQLGSSPPRCDPTAPSWWWAT